MTKSNLKSHLKWLLDQGPSLYPVLSPSAWESQVNINATQSLTVPIPILNPPATQIEEVRIKDSQPVAEQLIQKLAEDGNAVDSDTDMARLQFAPESASKPRMLSCSKKSTGGSLKSSQFPPLSSSPTKYKETRTPKRKGAREVRSPLASFHETDVAVTAPRSGRKLDAGPFDYDIDTIDLTGDLDRVTASSETAEEFGEPRRLWAEEAASRKEPIDNRGKKRKSDEYASDIVPTKRNGTKGRSPLVASRNMQLDQHDKAQYRDSILSTQKGISPSPTGRQSQSMNKWATPARVIYGSDDDGDDSLFDDLLEEKQETNLEADQLFYPVLPQAKQSDDQCVDRSVKRREPISPDSIDAPEKTRSQQVAVHNNKTPRRDVSSPSQPPSSNSEPLHSDVEKLLLMSDHSLESIITRTKDTLTRNSEIVYQQAMKGELAPELIAENKTLADRIEAIETLRKKREAYQAREAEQKSLKQFLMKTILQGRNPAELPELEQSRRVKTQLDEIQADILRLLRKTDILSSSEKLVLEQPLRFPERSRASPPKSPMKSNPIRGGYSSQTPDDYRSSFKQPQAKPSLNSSGSRLQSSTRATTSLTRSTKASSKHRQFEYDDPMVSDDEMAFTRTIGSPVPLRQEMDEFDSDEFDHDMLEAADYFNDDERLFPTEDHQIQSRKVFAETSGNVSRAPAMQKSQGHRALWNQHPWSKGVRNVLKDRFQLRGFRMNQLEAIDATLSGKDTFVLMPTGGGKSLCYQLPSVVSSGSTKGVTIVISPLLSLMHDQVFHLRKLKIKAFLLNGETPMNERQQIISTLSYPGSDEDIELLYITPEMITKSQALAQALEKLNRRQRLARIVIDEAHCVSQWGHDFRPDYKELGELRDQLPGVPMMALTATATENVKVDVIHNLKMEGCQIFTQSFNRPNLTYEVLPKKKGAQLLASIANIITGTYRNKCGIVYCLSRDSCEKVAKSLRDDYRIKAEHYHAGLDPKERAEIQQRWQSGETHVMVATIAFGMGIDKPDVRFVIHHTIPKSLEGYYQETGRAGRDGRRSGCYLYYCYRDTAALMRMIDGGEGSKQQKNRQRQMLHNVVQYCENRSDCRRVQILAYFNEQFRRGDCNSSCDNCKSDSVFELHDFSKHAAAAIKIVRYFQDLGDKVTMSYCVNIFRGSVKRFRSPEHKQAPCSGDGSDLELGEAERLFHRLLGEGALKEENVVNGSKFAIQYVKLGRRAADFESGRCRLKLDVRISPNGKSRSSTLGTRSEASKESFPQSTNVSSPVQSANRRRLAHYRYNNAQGANSDSERDSDGFERIRIGGKQGREKRKLPGPPITQDHRFDQLDPLHKAVAEDFMVYAKDYCQDVVLKKGLRNQPFTDTILREMVIVFPKDKSELLAIPGIDEDKVHRYGDRILKLIRDTQRRYDELRKDRDDADGIVPDPNHHNVVNLTSDDEFQCSDCDDILGQASALDQPDNVVSSRFFSTAQQTADDSDDEYQTAPTESGGRKPRKRQTNKRFRRQKSESRPRAKISRPKTKSKIRADSGSAPRKGPKGSQSTSRMAMMPI